MAYLQKLKFTNVSRKSTVDPVMRRRDKLLGKLDEQRNTAEHALDGKVYTVMKRGWVTDTETGDKKRVDRPKNVRAWYWETAGVWYFQVRYGAKLLDLGNDKPTIEVGDKDNLLEVIDVCINATKDGEFDKQLTEIAGATTKKLRR